MKKLKWIKVNDQMPEQVKELVIKPEDRFNAERTQKVLVFTDCGNVVDNKRIKMSVGKKEWLWFMDVDGEIITHWAIFNQP